MGIAESSDSGKASYGKTLGESNEQRRGTFILWGRRRTLGDVLLNKLVGEKKEFSVMTISHWLSCSGSGFLVGDAVYIFPC